MKVRVYFRLNIDLEVLRGSQAYVYSKWPVVLAPLEAYK